MEFEFSENSVKILNTVNFDLSQTFGCGQCFRWNKFENKFFGAAFGEFVSLTQNGTTVIIENTNEEKFNLIWKDYFDLESNYKFMAEHLSDINPILDKAIRECSGIRILKQDPWEALCSFIISQNNNIPRIKKIVNSLCVKFGGNLADGIFTFPKPEILAACEEEDLASVRAGFRARYIIDAARKVSEGTLDFLELKNMPPEEASGVLMQIIGVGPKIAECVRLYGLHDFRAFPIDVWMKKIMEKLFPGVSSDIFGDFRGLAQQYLYHYIRLHPDVIA